MEEILELLHRSNRDLFAYLDAQQIKPGFQKKQVIFEKEIEDQIYTVSVMIHKNTVVEIRIACPKLVHFHGDRYENLIQNTKRYLELRYGIPSMDNTNHRSESVYVTYEKENVIAAISGENGMYGEGIYSFFVLLRATDVKMGTGFGARAILYLLGGLAWGLVMFLVMAAGNYNWTAFRIFMEGGVAFAVLFGVGMEIAFRLDGRNRPKTIRKYDRKFSEYEKGREYELAIPLTMYPGMVQARLYIKGREAEVCYCGNRLKHLETDLKNIDDNLYPQAFSLMDGKKNYNFGINQEDDFLKLVAYLETQFYKEDAYRQIRDKIERAFKTYNPYSKLNHDENAFAYDIFYVTKQLYKKPDVTLSDMKKILMYMDLDEDMNVESVMVNELAVLILQQMP